MNLTNFIRSTYDLIQDSCPLPQSIIEANEKDYQARILDPGEDVKHLMSLDPHSYLEDLKLRINQVFNQDMLHTTWNMAIQIADELVAETKGVKPDHHITNDEVNTLPPEMRPLLTGTQMTVGLDSPIFPVLYSLWQEYKMSWNLNAYNLFRTGLDFSDIDSLTYQVLQQNPADISFWYPYLSSCVEQQTFFKLPETKIAKLPLPLLQLTRLCFETLGPATMKVVEDYSVKIFELNPSKSYFIRTGVGSTAKDDFGKCYIKQDSDDCLQVGKLLLAYHNKCSMMASPKNKTRCYGAATTATWVVREYIPDPEDNPTICNGLPLRTEFRAFVDFSFIQPKVLAIAPRWEHDFMKSLLSQKPEDWETYQSHEENIMFKYTAFKFLVCSKLEKLFSAPRGENALNGQWSVDIMMSGDEIYIIDMAPAQDSALNNYIPVKDKHFTSIDWIPRAVLQHYDTN